MSSFLFLFRRKEKRKEAKEKEKPNRVRLIRFKFALMRCLSHPCVKGGGSSAAGWIVRRGNRFLSFCHCEPSRRMARQSVLLQT